MKERPTVWTLTQAVDFLTRLQAHLRPRWFVGLTGSVLYSGGHSRNDLDVLVYPASSAHPDIEGLKASLESFGLKLLYDRDVVVRRWRRLGSDDCKHVEVWEHEGRRVDLFFVQ